MRVFLHLEENVVKRRDDIFEGLKVRTDAKIMEMPSNSNLDIYRFIVDDNGSSYIIKSIKWVKNSLHFSTNPKDTDSTLKTF